LQVKVSLYSKIIPNHLNIFLVPPPHPSISAIYTMLGDGGKLEFEDCSKWEYLANTKSLVMSIKYFNIPDSIKKRLVY